MRFPIPDGARRLRRSLLVGLVALAAGAAFAAAGCGGGDSGGGGDSSGGGGGLVVYSGRSEELVGPVYDRFEQTTGIDLDVRYGESVDLALLLGEEGDRSPADVFVSQSPGSVAFLAGKGLLSALPQATLDRVPARFRDDGGDWVGITGRQRVLVYNTDLVKPADLPDSVLDLTDARYKGKVGVAPTNASFQDFVTAMRQISGEQAAERWLDGMAANGARSYAKNTAIVEAVRRGEIPMGLVNHYYVVEALADDPDAPIAAHRFAPGDVGGLFLVSTASVLGASGDGDRAQKLVDHLLSQESQEFFAQAEGEYPVAEGVAPKPGTPALATLKPPAYDISRLDDLQRTATLISESGIGN